MMPAKKTRSIAPNLNKTERNIDRLDFGIKLSVAHFDNAAYEVSEEVLARRS